MTRHLNRRRFVAGTAAAALAAQLPLPTIIKAAAVDQWGEVVGRLVYDGRPPLGKKLTVDKDVDCCGKFDIRDESLMAGVDGGLANVFIYVRDRGVNIHPELAEAAAKQVVLDNKDCIFKPHCMAVWVGKQDYHIVNSDPVAQNVAYSPFGDVPANIVLPVGGTAIWKFRRAQTAPVPIKCNYHPWESALVLPRDNPYVAVSAPDGTFRIPNLPVGKLELQVWQERLTYLNTPAWPKGRIALVIKPGVNDLGTVKLAPALFENQARRAAAPAHPDKVIILTRPTPSVPIRSLARLACVLAALVAAGCAGPPEFALNTEGRDPESISLAQRDEIASVLAEMFGTPDEPRLPPGVGLDLARLRAAAGPVGGEADGTQRGLFRQHCASCHGVSGDGAGPAAWVLNPYPRDYRGGVFKFTSTLAGHKPVRDDLRRTLRRGVPGTAMPSFIGLPDAELESLVEYVMYLSIRGETELYLMRLIVDEDEYVPLDPQMRDVVLTDGAQAAFAMWTMAQEFVIEPPSPPTINTTEERLASIAKGRELYLGKDAQCAKCHGPDGYGDGEQTDIYDDWNKPKQGVTPEQTKKLAALFTLPIQQIRPRNFHEGSYRGGATPFDLYCRIYGGIKGTPMPAAGASPGVPGVLEPDEVWHVVNYIRSLRGR